VDLTTANATALERGAILAHYEHFAPLIAANFPRIPLVFEQHPNGLGGATHYSNRNPIAPMLPGVTPVTVHTTTGAHVYPACDEFSILAYVYHWTADGVHSWTPVPGKPEAVRFARIQLKPENGSSQQDLRDALILVRDILRAHRVEAIPLWGGRDAALFIPFADAPAYPPVRQWLHVITDEAHARSAHIRGEHHAHEQRTERDIELTLRHNAPGEHSRLPYSLTGAPDLPMLTPFDWSELDTLPNGYYTATNAEERLAQGDVFKRLTDDLAHQTFAAVTR
jgi:DNA primase